MTPHNKICFSFKDSEDTASETTKIPVSHNPREYPHEPYIA